MTTRRVSDETLSRWCKEAEQNTYMIAGKDFDALALDLRDALARAEAAEAREAVLTAENEQLRAACAGADYNKGYTDGHAVATERFAAKIKEIEARESAALAQVKVLMPVYEAAYGLSFGTDWNNGNHAIKHGYRHKLVEAVKTATRALTPASDEGR